MSGLSSLWRARWSKPALFIVCLTPVFRLYFRFRTDDLGPNPIEELTHVTGDWAMWILLASLSISPLRKIFGQPDLIRFRKMLGLFAFFYAILHFTIWGYLDKMLNIEEMWEDVLFRRFITAGMVSLLIMIPLAITSTAGWIRRMGGKNWRRLHRLVYISAISAIVHYWWIVKSDIRYPALYAAILILLFALRWIPVKRSA